MSYTKEDLALYQSIKVDPINKELVLREIYRVDVNSYINTLKEKKSKLQS